MNEFENENDVIENEEELFGPSTQPITPLLPLPEELHIGPNGDRLNLPNEEGAKVEEEEKKKRTIHRVTLNEDRITGKNGILKLSTIANEIKFKGKGHEKEDLDLLLGKLEHWAHILMPRQQFVDVVERIEVLGSRGIVKRYADGVKKGTITLDDNNVLENNEEQQFPNANGNSDGMQMNNGADNVNNKDARPSIEDEIDALMENDFGDLLT